jgi:hypothetical protein
MTADHAPRLFASDAAVRRVGEGLLDRSLPRPDWTHEAHLAACLYLLRERAEIDLPAEMPGIISGYNEAVGGRNTDSEGYHETITQAYIQVIRGFLATRPAAEALVDAVNALLTSPMGQRDHLLGHWTKPVLFSVAARRGWVEPDLRPLGAGAGAAQSLS